MKCSSGRASRAALVLGGWLVACAPLEDEQRREADAAPAAAAPPLAASGGGAGDVVSVERAHPEDARGPDDTEPPPASDRDGTSTAPRCVPAPGTTGAPATIAELMELLAGLPRPTTLACLLQSLERPLEVYLTSSTLSAQPAPAERSPRTFVVLGPLVLSVVAEGEASRLLELGYRSAPGRSIKAELPFPLRQAPAPDDLLDQVGLGRVSMCGGCHTNERRVADAFFDGSDGAFESDIIPPLYVYQVDVDVLRGEAERCDAGQEPERCELLGALFDHGEVRQTELWSEQP